MSPGDGSCLWLADMVLLSVWSQNKVLAGGLTGLGWTGDGANGILAPGLHLSAVMARWQPPDGSIGAAEGSPDSYARLMNCEMRQTYKSSRQTRPTPAPLLIFSPDHLLCGACIHLSKRTCCRCRCEWLLGAKPWDQAKFRTLLKTDWKHLSHWHFSWMWVLYFITFDRSLLSLSHQHLHQAWAKTL